MKKKQTYHKMPVRAANMMEKAIADYVVDYAKKSGNIYNNLLDKVSRLSQNKKFDPKVDPFALSVANSVMNQYNKMEERKLKSKEVEAKAVTQFHQLLKDANAGNVTKETIIELEQQADKGAD